MFVIYVAPNLQQISEPYLFVICFLEAMPDKITTDG